jgi:hypothetical protein
MAENNNGAFRNVSTQPNRDESELFLHNFTPMIDTLQNMNKNNPADSTCTRVIRKKFFCICVFFMTIITIMYFCTTVVDKLSQNDIQHLYKSITQFARKFTPIMSKNNTIEYTTYDTNSIK